MWLSLAFLSASMLGLYDVAKKQALRDNAVLPVLLLNTFFLALFFSPLLLSYYLDLGWFDVDLSLRGISWGEAHLLVFLKAIIVLASWICGYFALKHLPLTTAGPINATRPMVVLAGAMLIYGERLNAYQWGGILLSVASLFLLSRSSRREGIDFKRNKWILMLALAALLGASSGLFDKYLMTRLEPFFMQAWYNVYQLLLMALIVGMLWLPRRHRTTPFRWHWAIPMISVFLTLADMAYFFALHEADSMLSMVSMIRRSSVVVSFACGALLFKEKNLRAKAMDLVLILLGMLLIWWGTH